MVFALVAAGGVGYLWYAGKLPGLSDSGTDTGTTTAAGAQKRDVIVVHLHDTENGGTSTALLVDNTTTRQGTTVLLPNSLALTAEDGTTTTLAKSVDDDGSEGHQDRPRHRPRHRHRGHLAAGHPVPAHPRRPGRQHRGRHRRRRPDPDARKKGEAPLVRKGKKQTLSGKMAVAYATHRAPGEAQNAQLERFGQVLHAVLRKMTSDPDAATVTVQTLGQIIEPPLTDADLGAFLAGLSDLAKGGDHRTALLPVEEDGTLTAEASDGVVKDVLGGTAKSPDRDAAVTVSVRNATGDEDTTEKARVVLLNGGFTDLPGGRHRVLRRGHLRGRLRRPRREGERHRGRQDPGTARRLRRQGQDLRQRARGGGPRPGLRPRFVVRRGAWRTPRDDVGCARRSVRPLRSTDRRSKATQ